MDALLNKAIDRVNSFCNLVHMWAKNQGFWKLHDIAASSNQKGGFKAIKHALIAQKLALISSECAEALEADRKGLYCTKYDLESVEQAPDANKKEMFEQHIKNSIGDELADIIIRTGDLAGYLEIDLQKHIALKMEYNNSKPQWNGKSY